MLHRQPLLCDCPIAIDHHHAPWASCLWSWAREVIRASLGIRGMGAQRKSTLHRISTVGIAGRNIFPFATPSAWRRAALGSRRGALPIRLISAPPEPIIGLYQTVVILARRPWRDLEPVEFARLEWVHSFNHRRILEVVGNRPPAEAKADYHRQRDHTALAA